MSWCASGLGSSLSLSFFSAAFGFSLSRSLELLAFLGRFWMMDTWLVCDQPDHIWFINKVHTVPYGVTQTLTNHLETRNLRVIRNNHALFWFTFSLNRFLAILTYQQVPSDALGVAVASAAACPAARAACENSAHWNDISVSHIPSTPMGCVSCNQSYPYRIPIISK